MARRKHRAEDDRDRMAAAVRRLEALILDPGLGNSAYDASEPSLTTIARGPRTGRDLPANTATRDGGDALKLHVAADGDVTKTSTGQLTDDWGVALARSVKAPPGRPKSEAPLSAEEAPPAPINSHRAGMAERDFEHHPRGFFGRLLNALLGDDPSEAKDAIAANSSALKAALIFSAVANILQIAGPFLIVLIFDGVLISKNETALFAFAGIAVGIFAVAGLLAAIRSRLMMRVALDVDRQLSGRLFDAGIRQSVTGSTNASSPLFDLARLRAFIAGPAPVIAVELATAPAALILIALAHPILGALATLITAVVAVVGWLAERRHRRAWQAACVVSTVRREFGVNLQRHASTMSALGMVSAFRERFVATASITDDTDLDATDRVDSVASLLTVLRSFSGVAMLTAATTLALLGEISGGTVIVAALLMDLVIAPVSRGVGVWRTVVAAAASYDAIEDVLAATPSEKNRTALPRPPLPRPTGQLQVQNLRINRPGTRTFLLNGICFTALPGQIIGVVGASASGKSTLARALVGLLPPFGGSVLLDHARLDQWHPDVIGRHIGYFSQDGDVIAGTIAQNIARFQSDATDGAIVDAAKQALVHQDILALPDGYQTLIGASGAHLSGGQRQRLALARALFGQPPLVVLDTPPLLIDAHGTAELPSVLEQLRRRRQTVIVITDDAATLQTTDRLVVLEAGQQRAFGPRDDVLAMLNRSPATSHSAMAVAAAAHDAAR